MGVVECRSTLCIQLFKQGPSMRGCSRYGGSRLLGGTSSTAVLGSFDSSRRTPPGGSTGTFTIGKEGLRLREGKTETLTRTGHVSSVT